MSDRDISEFRDASRVVVEVGMPRYGEDVLVFENTLLAYRAIDSLGGLVDDVHIRD